MAAFAARSLFCRCGVRKLLLSNALPRTDPLSCSVTTTSKLSAAWNRDWKPGPYPETQAEREAAAAKYGLRIEDYEPYNPEEDPGYGDYPKVKWMGVEGKDPYEEFDYPHLGTNYKEVIHARADQSTDDRYNPNWEEQSYFSEAFMLATVSLIFFGGMGLHILCDYYSINIHMPAMPKQYPDHLWIQRGRDPDKMPEVVHYTFEPASTS